MKKNNATSVDLIKKNISDVTAYYSSDLIDSTNAVIRWIIGKRKNGKSYGALKRAIKEYATKKRTSFYLRREKEDIKTQGMSTLFSAHIKNGLVEKYTNGEYNTIIFYNKNWYFAKSKIDKETGIETITRSKTPFMYALALSAAEQYKSSLSDPDCYTIIFDEVLATADAYLPGEWALFVSIYSSLKRDKPDSEFVCYMIGNTLNPFCPYFRNMGINKIYEQKKGTIQIYNFAGSFKMAVELTREEGPANSKLTDGFFWAFDDPTIKMSRDGDWELENFPLMKETDAGEFLDTITPENSIFRFYIIFDDETVMCTVVDDKKGIYCLCHTTNKQLRQKDYENELIYCATPSIRPNIRDTFQQPRDDLDKRINRLYNLNLFRYDENFTGIIVKNFLNQFDE